MTVYKKKEIALACSLDSRKAMMVAGMRPRMPPPSMLRIVVSFLVDGGDCGTVVSAEAEAVPVMSMGETGAEIDQYQRIQELKNDQPLLQMGFLDLALWMVVSAGSRKLFVSLKRSSELRSVRVVEPSK